MNQLSNAVINAVIQHLSKTAGTNTRRQDFRGLTGHPERGQLQQQIADAKGCHPETVRVRCKLHESCPDVARKATQDGMFDEGHLIAIIGITQDVLGLHPWLTTEQAQTELTQSILEKHLQQQPYPAC